MKACTPATPTGFPGSGIGAIRSSGELIFATLPDPAALECLGGIPFTMTTEPGGTTNAFVGPALVGRVLLNPDSANFTSPEPGVLQYIGPSGIFALGSAITVELMATDSPTGVAIISSQICLNGQPIFSSAAQAIMSPLLSAVTGSVVLATLNGQAIVELNRGDVLSICLADVGVEITGVPATDSLCIFQVSLLAQQV